MELEALTRARSMGRMVFKAVDTFAANDEYEINCSVDEPLASAGR